MAHWRRAAKRDKAEGPIVKAYRMAGATVQPINVEDAPDLIVGYEGENYLVEIKTGKGKLRKGQEDWHAAWQGRPVIVARTPSEALSEIGVPNALIDRILAEGGWETVKNAPKPKPPKKPKGGK